MASISIRQAFNPLDTEGIKNRETDLLWEGGCASHLGSGCRTDPEYSPRFMGVGRSPRSPSPTPTPRQQDLSGPRVKASVPTPRRSAAGTAPAPLPHSHPAYISFVPDLGSGTGQEEGCAPLSLLCPAGRHLCWQVLLCLAVLSSTVFLVCLLCPCPALCSLLFSPSVIYRSCLSLVGA